MGQEEGMQDRKRLLGIGGRETTQTLKIHSVHPIPSQSISRDDSGRDPGDPRRGAVMRPYEGPSWHIVDIDL